MDNHIRNIEEKIKDKQIGNAYMEVGSLKAGFQPHTAFAETQIKRFYLREKK
jgi:hypothetical protein